MIKKSLHLSSFKLFFAMVSSLSCCSLLNAGPVGSDSFCLDTCKPPVCAGNLEIKSRCQELCGSRLEEIAAMQVKQPSQDSASKPDYTQTDIYQCLKSEPGDQPINPAAARESSSSPDASQADLCQAALRAEMDNPYSPHPDLGDAIEALK